MGNALVTSSGGRTRTYPLATIPVTTNLGAGRLIYVTDDERLGVQLDGESRVDEYRAVLCDFDRSVLSA